MDAARDLISGAPAFPPRAALWLVSLSALALWALLNGEVTSAFVWAVVAGVCLSAVFVACRGLMLARASGLEPLEGGRLFAEGAVIEVLSWPGKVWADGYRAVRIPGRPIDKVGAIARFRGGCLLGWCLAATLLFALVGGESGADWARWGSLVVVFGVATVLVVSATRWRGRVHGVDRTPGVVFDAGLGVVATLADALAMGVIASALCGTSVTSVAVAHVLVSLVAAASMLPLGVGVFEGLTLFVLTGPLAGHTASTEAALSVMLAYRLTGPGLTLLIGLTSLGIRLHSRTATRKARTNVLVYGGVQ